MSKRRLDDLRDEAEIKRAAAGLTRRTFMVGAAGALGAAATWGLLKSRPEENGRPWPFRRTLQLNEALASAYFDAERLAPTFADAAGKVPRANGMHGLKKPIDLSAWTLRVENTAVNDGAVRLTMPDVLRLPRTEFGTYLYCIEGWSDKGHWAGTTFADFMRAYPPKTRSGTAPDIFRRPEDLPRYVSMRTPDGGYYVGWDLLSLMQSQTILAYEMGGRPLTPDHGAPLRLYSPIKYGIKSIKRIGTIRYTDERPTDYWFERGYDWYAGL